LSAHNQEIVDDVIKCRSTIASLHNPESSNHQEQKKRHNGTQKNLQETSSSKAHDPSINPSLPFVFKNSTFEMITTQEEENGKVHFTRELKPAG